jgi:hypothetical protein
VRPDVRYHVLRPFVPKQPSEEGATALDFSHLRWRSQRRRGPFDVLGPGTPAGTARDRPDHEPALTARDWAIYLLHAAAEIEHSLMVEYLYAAMTLNPGASPDAARQQKVRRWKSTLMLIAKEEMGHLISVQNLLLILGGPIHFERDSFPTSSEFYPFAFEIEPLTRESLAKYVLAEMPENPNPALPGDLLERAKITTAGEAVNRVGALYSRLYCLFSTDKQTGTGWADCKIYPKEDHLGDDDFVSGFEHYQADQDSWSPLPGAANPNVAHILIPKVTTRDQAREALKEIGEQGEGTSGKPGGEPSHFDRFLAIYKDPDFPETDPELGPIDWRPSFRVPTNPNTNTGAKRDGSTINYPRAKQWAELFNFRYRLLLAYLAHYVQTDDAVRRKKLIEYAIGEMQNLTLVGNTLVTLPLIDPGDSRRAGPPFELPYTLDLPIREIDRWRRHIDVLDDADTLIKLIMSTYSEDLANSDLQGLLDGDGIARAYMKPLSRPATPAPSGSAPGSGGASPTPRGTPAPAPGGTPARAPGGTAAPAPGGTGQPGGAAPPVASGSVHWPRVKQILDGAIADWSTKHGRAPKLKQRHGNNFAWDTKAELAAAVANIGGTPYRLIDPSMIGNGKGRQTNLIVALSQTDGVDGNGQMPDAGPFLTDTHPTYIDEIVRWIDDGMPD